MKTIPLAITLGLVACGAPIDDEDIGEDELGQLEQGMSAPTTPTYQYGTRTATARGRCNKTAAGQVCQVPPTKAINWTLTADLLHYFPGTETHAVINGFDAATNFSFTEIPQADLLPQRHISISLNDDACGTVGTASNDVRNYSCFNWSAPNGMTEVAGTVGSYQWSLLCNITLDVTAINNKGTNASQRGFFTRHAIAHAVAGCLGLGNRTEASAVATRQDMNSGVERSALTSGEICTLNAFASGTPTVWGSGGVCPTD